MWIDLIERVQWCQTRPWKERYNLATSALSLNLTKTQPKLLPDETRKKIEMSWGKFMASWGKFWWVEENFWWVGETWKIEKNWNQTGAEIEQNWIWNRFFTFFKSISNSNPVLINFNTVLISVFEKFSIRFWFQFFSVSLVRQNFPQFRYFPHFDRCTCVCQFQQDH